MVQRKTNPRTHIVQVQKAFEADLYHRLIQPPPEGGPRPLKRAIVRKVVEQDALGLQEAAGSVSQLAAPGGIEQHQFEFPENPRKTAAFEDWLQDKLDRGVLEPADRQLVTRGGHYTGEYVRSASRRGIKHGNRELRRVGIPVDDEPLRATFNAPIHRDILESAYIRSYDELESITRDMSVDISRAMSDGLREGWGPERTAREMNGRVDVGMTRGRRMARTELARPYNDHSLGRYSEHGVEEVRILTSDPCDLCADFASSGPYPVNDAPSLPGDSHPSCVCSYAPVV